MLDTLAGNAALKSELQTALREKKLAHSLLLCGESGAGVNFAARCLAADYLYPEGGDGAAQVMAGESPEYLVLAGEGVSGDIKIARVREVRTEIYNTALSSEGRVVHIRGAERLNLSSANALLKVLEEPPDGVLFVLTAPDEASVLPTLRSRCNRYTVCSVPAEECAAYLHARFPRAKNTAELARLFSGRIGAAVRVLSQPAAAARLEDAKKLAQALLSGETYAALCLLSHYEKDRAVTRELLQSVREICALELTGPQAARAASILPRITEADAALAANGNQKLVLATFAARAGTLKQ